MQYSHRFQKAIQLFDKANQQDPNQTDFEGIAYPKEFLYADRMSKRLKTFAPEASETLALATHAQHICRWEIPRTNFAMDRKGYHQWRNDLKLFHAKTAGQMMNEVGYQQEDIERVQFLIQKKKIKTDAETQTLEDVICLVFLEFYFEDFAKNKEEEKIVSILQKTLVKMSEKGKAAAMEIDFSNHGEALIKKALAT